MHRSPLLLLLLLLLLLHLLLHAGVLDGTLRPGVDAACGRAAAALQSCLLALPRHLLHPASRSPAGPAVQAQMTAT